MSGTKVIHVDLTNKTNTNNKKPGKPGKPPGKPIPNGAGKPNKGRKNNIKKDKKVANQSNNAVVNLSKDLTKHEESKGTALISNILSAGKAVQMPRLVPSYSTPIVVEGEVIFDASSIYQEIVMAPDPFEFIRIRTGTSPSNVTYTDVQYNNNFANKGDKSHTALPTVGFSTFFLSEPLKLINGTVIEPHAWNGAEAQIPGPHYHIKDGNQVQEAGGSAYAGITSLVGLQIRYSNRSAISMIAATFIAEFNIASGAYIQEWVGLSQQVAAGTDNFLMNNFILPTVFPNTSMFAFGLRLQPTSNGAYVSGVDFSLTAGTITFNGTSSTKVYTLGGARYGSEDDVNAIILQNAFRDALLWAPNSMNATLNVDQQLNTAGGRFLAAYLPSHIEDYLDETLIDEWTQINGFANSYPVAEAPFEKGCHGCWVGARIADYEPRRPFINSELAERAHGTLPKVIFMSYKVNSDVVLKYRLKFSCVLEIQSMNPLLTMKLSPCSTELIPVLMQIWGQHKDLVGHNPNHFQRIKSLTMQAMRDPRVRSALKSLLTAGVSALPLLL